MRRWSAAAALALGLSVISFAQESPQSRQAETRNQEAAPEMSGWMWINFAILVGGLGYLVAKSAPAIFTAREREIRGGIDEAARKKKDAEARASDTDRKLAGFAGDIEKLRREILAEMSAEGERIRQDTARQARRMEEQARQEIGFLTKSATQQLRTYSADLALRLAQQRIQARMNRETQHALVSDFLAGLRHT